MIPLSWVLVLAGILAAGLFVSLALGRAAAAGDRQLAEFDAHADDALAVVADDRLVERLRAEFSAPAGSVVDSLLDVLGRAVAERDEARHDAQLLRDELAEYRTGQARDARTDLRAA